MKKCIWIAVKSTGVVMIACIMSMTAVTSTYVSAQEADQTVTSAETTTPTETATEPVPYHYNDSTGLWENGTYAWDSETNQTTPMQEVDYSYNPTTESWDTTEWKSTDGGEYQANTNPVITYDVGNNVETLDAAATTQPTQEAANTSEDKAFFENYYDVAISGSITATAVSGNALVFGNTIAGNAVSGNAGSYATVLNLLQSNWSGGAPTYYSATIQGGHYGDLLIDPGDLALGSSQVSNTHELTVQNTTNASINTSVDLQVASGSAEVSGNTVAGSAETGDAVAVANIMNLIQSSIAANRSFIGVLNIIGDLEGDVLLPSELSNTLLAAQVPSMTIAMNNDNTISVENTQQYAANTTVDLKAVTGDVTVSHNTQAGSAMSGNAETTFTVFNLTGREIIGSDALLVFVNVSGEWIGFLTNNPAGTRSSIYGDSSMNISPSEQDYGLTGNYGIHNDIHLHAQSGDATVTKNTIAGNAESGDAYASATVMNMTHSALSFNGWFGALFINIFGNWFGSFGTDTSYGGYSTQMGGSVAGGESQSGSGNVSAVLSGATTQSESPRIIIASISDAGGKKKLQQPVVLSDSNDSTSPASTSEVRDITDQPETTIITTKDNVTRDYTWMSIMFVLIASALFIIIRSFTFDRRRATITY